MDLRVLAFVPLKVLLAYSLQLIAFLISSTKWEEIIVIKRMYFLFSVIFLLFLNSAVKAQNVGCAPDEVERVINFSLQQAEQVIEVEEINLQRMMEQTIAFLNSLSVECVNALMLAQHAQQQYGNPNAGGNYGGGIPKVLDHGNGTLSVPGVGFCGSGGCGGY